MPGPVIDAATSTKDRHSHSLQMKVYMVSLGCPKNRVDSERALWALKEAGAELTLDEAEADILIANTCGFVNDAKEESIETILSLARLKENKPGVKLAVMGCLTARYRDDLARSVPEIDYFYGVNDLNALTSDLTSRTQALLPDPENGHRVLTTSPYWAYLKVAEGCSNNCSFCVIPSIRGPYKSRALAPVVDEALRLAQQGVKELIVVAQDTTLYGADIKDKRGLSNLLLSLAAIDGVEWVRTMYMYPALINRELLEIFSSEEKLAPYFDIPLQHVSDSVLKRMNRPETFDSICRLIDDIRGKVPEAAIRTSFIIGFPGETDADFERLLEFIKEARFDHMGAFIFSPEEGTEAFDMPDRVEESVARERYAQLMIEQKKIASELSYEKIGKVYSVLVDKMDPDEKLLTGRIITQAPEIDGCVILDSVEARPGDMTKVRVSGATDYDLIGTTP